MGEIGAAIANGNWLFDFQPCSRLGHLPCICTTRTSPALRFDSSVPISANGTTPRQRLVGVRRCHAGTSRASRQRHDTDDAPETPTATMTTDGDDAPTNDRCRRRRRLEEISISGEEG